MKLNWNPVFNYSINYFMTDCSFEEFNTKLIAQSVVLPGNFTTQLSALNPSTTYNCCVSAVLEMYSSTTCIQVSTSTPETTSPSDCNCHNIDATCNWTTTSSNSEVHTTMKSSSMNTNTIIAQSSSSLATSVGTAVGAGIGIIILLIIVLVIAILLYVLLIRPKKCRPVDNNDYSRYT